VLKVLYRIIYDKCIRIQKQVLQSNTRSFETKCGSLAWSSSLEHDFFREAFFIYQVENERNLLWKIIWKFVKIVKLPKQRDKLVSNDVVPKSKYQKSKHVGIEGFWVTYFYRNNFLVDSEYP